MSHPNEDQLGTQAPYEGNEPKSSVARTPSAESMNPHRCRQLMVQLRLGGGLCEQRQVHFVPILVELSGQGCRHVLSAAAAQMGNEQKDSDSGCRAGTHAAEG